MGSGFCKVSFIGHGGVLMFSCSVLSEFVKRESVWLFRNKDMDETSQIENDEDEILIFNDEDMDETQDYY
jgi:hypothetical protein